jgi:DNA polymerase-4
MPSRTNDKTSQGRRGIIHVDMDAFYASVEVMDNPDLEGKAVIVGGTPEGRGVVAAASYESRKFGVHSAMSAARAKRLCPHAVFIHPRMSRYAELSRQIRDIFCAYTPLVEPISLDEAFLDVTGSRALFGSPEDIGRAIKRRIREEVGLVASVGIAPNKYLAKLASDLEKPDGFVVIRQEEAQERLAPLPVGRLWGIGKVSQKKLSSMGIETIGDLLRMPMDALEGHFGVHARRLKGLGMGVDDRRVVPNWDARSLSAETTFAKDIGDAEELRDIVDSLADKVARRIRKGGYLAYTIQLKARYADFTTVTRAHTVGEATAQTPVIRDAARLLLEEKLGRNGRALRLLGVGASHIVRIEEAPALLFEDDASRKNRTLDDAMDSLQDRFGTGAIHRGKGRRRTGWD